MNFPSLSAPQFLGHFSPLASSTKPRREEPDPPRLINQYMQEISQFTLTKVQRAELLDRIAQGDETAKQPFIQANLKLVAYVAKGLEGFGLSFLDLIQEGNIALMKAVENFKPGEFEFSTYAFACIKGEMLTAINNQARTIRIPVHIESAIAQMRKNPEHLPPEILEQEAAQRNGTTVDRLHQGLLVAQPMVRFTEIMSAYRSGTTTKRMYRSPEEMIAGEKDPLATRNASVDKELLQEAFDEALAKLKPRDEKVLRLRFGLPVKDLEVTPLSQAKVPGEEWTLEEIGRLLGVGRERVRQIEARALRALRHPKNGGNLLRQHFYEMT